MTFGSLFSGIEGFGTGLERAGMQCKWQVEIDEQCQALLSSRFPHVERFKDIASVGANELVRVDWIVGGFPCQDVSVAGRRAGLAGERSGLWWQFHRIIAALRPSGVVIENVPGLLSSNGGRDFGAILGSLAELGYGFAYRILDAQWFGVPQRRRRVFIVGCLGDWRRAAEILFERESLPWDSPPSREERARVAASLTSGAATGSGVNRPGRRREDDVNIVPIDMRQASRGEKMTNNRREGTSGGAPGTGIGKAGDACPTLADSHTPAIVCALDAHMGMGGVDDNAAQAGHVVAHALTDSGNGRYDPNGETFVYQEQGAAGCGELGTLKASAGNRGVSGGIPFVAYRTSGNCGVMEQGDKTAALNCATDPNQNIVSGKQLDGVMVPILEAGARQGTRNSARDGIGIGSEGDPMFTLQAGKQHAIGLRRLMPVECERLQGFPDGWTEGFSDSARYRMLGNAVAVPVAEWIGKRITEATQ